MLTLLSAAIYSSDMGYLDVTGNIALIHYTNNTMMARQNEQDVASILEGLIGDIHT